MTKLRIIIDPRRQWPGAGSHLLHVRTEDEYYRARLQLRTSRRDQEPLTIWVTAPTLAGRFDDLRSDPEIEVVEYKPRRELARLLGLEDFPDLVTEDLVTECDLLIKAREEPRRAEESGLSWVLRVTLGEPWGYAQLVGAQPALALRSLASSGANLGALSELVAWQLRQWGRTGQVAEAWDWLAEDPRHRARCLLACWATEDYGERRLQWLTQEGYDPSEVSQAIEYTPLFNIGPAEASGAVDHRLRQLIVGELRARLEKEGPAALGSARARVHEELTAVQSYIEQRARSRAVLDSDEVAAVGSWTETFRGDARAEELELAAHLMEAVPLPSPLPEDAKWTQVARWIDASYLPAYCCRAVSGDLAATTPLVQSFERWVAQQYRRQMRREGVGLHWFGAAAGQRQQEAAVVVVVLDGMPYQIVKWLTSRLRSEGGMRLASRDTYLAMLPTTTETSAGSLVSGRLPDETRKDDRESVAKNLRVAPQKLSLTAESVPDLSKTITMQPEDALVCHYLGVDRELLHKPMPALQRWLGAYRIARQVAEKVDECFRAAEERSLPLWLGCINDHGWTELPEEAEAVGLPDDLAASVDHARVIRGSAEETYGFALDRGEFFLPESCTVAAGYRYFGTRPHGAVHGGATPQEMAVFGFWLTNTEAPKLEDIGIEILGEVRRGRAHNSVYLRISNPNAAVVQVTALRLTGVGCCEDALPATIGPRDAVDLKAVCDASSAKELLTLTGRIDWQSSGTCRSQDVELRLETVGAARAVSEFEDMLGE